MVQQIVVSADLKLTGLNQALLGKEAPKQLLPTKASSARVMFCTRALMETRLDPRRETLWEIWVQQATRLKSGADWQVEIATDLTQIPI